MVAPAMVTSEHLAAYRQGDPDVAVRQAEAAIRAWCGWHVAPVVQETVLLDGFGGRHLWLPSLKVLSILRVESRGDSLEADAFAWSESGYVERRHGGRWPYRPRSVVVEFEHGFADAPVDLVAVAVAVADRSRATGGVTSESVGQVRVSFGTVSGVAGGLSLLAHEMDALAPYKLPPRA